MDYHHYTLSLFGCHLRIDLPKAYEEIIANPAFARFASDPVPARCDARLTCSIIDDPFDTPASVDASLPELGITDYPILHYSFLKDMVAGSGPDAQMRIEFERLFFFDPDRQWMKAFSCSRSFEENRLAINFFLFVFSACLLGKNHGILLHAFGLVIDGLACVITGPSGAGKSTAGSLIKKNFILADDLVGITGIGDRVESHATPLSSSRITDGPCRAPLAAIFFPVRSDRFHIRPLSPREGFIRYLHENGHYVGRLIKEYKPVYFELAHILFQQVPCYELHFSLEGIDTGEVRRVMEAGTGIGD